MRATHPPVSGSWSSRRSYSTDRRLQHGFVHAIEVHGGPSHIAGAIRHHHETGAGALSSCASWAIVAELGTGFARAERSDPKLCKGRSRTSRTIFFRASPDTDRVDRASPRAPSTAPAPESIAHAQTLITAWRDDYNHRRPHGALGQLTPSEYAAQRQKPTSQAATLQLAPVW